MAGAAAVRAVRGGVALRLGQMLASVLVLAATAAAADDGACLGCHDEAVSAEAFAASAHATLGCRTCHADIDDYPHPAEPARPACRSCHDEIADAVAHGVHAAGGDASAESARCADCHGDVHAARRHTDPGSTVHPSVLPGTCARCHSQAASGEKLRIPLMRPVETYLESVHARSVAAGRPGAVCSSCHGAHGIVPASDPRSPLARANVPATCGTCHAEALAAYRNSVHAVVVARGGREAPVCTDCHGEHTILAHTDPSSPVFPANLAGETCGRCHDSVRLTQKYGLARGQVASFQESFHGLALRAGRLEAANCASCHGVHDILPSRDPRSHVNPVNLPETCGKCHPGAGTTFTLGPIHVLGATLSAQAVAWVRFAYLWLIGVVCGAMLVHNLLDLVHKARRTRSPVPSPTAPLPERMSRALRWQHGLVMLTFPVLVYTGFALTYPETWWAAPLLRWERALGLRGTLHRVAAVLMLVSLGWHLGHLLASRRLRACLSGLRWSRRDARDVVRALGRSLGGQGPAPGREKFSYVEKVEYWAFLWGSVLMALTGFVLWFENASLRYLPHWLLDAATAIHFYEAILATAAIVVWHLYWVVFDPEVYPMDASWWHGRMPPARALERGLMETTTPAAPGESTDSRD
jgi:predicted CXXCH cytochrome family protein